jgi:hypothetical protein
VSPILLPVFSAAAVVSPASAAVSFSVATVYFASLLPAVSEEAPSALEPPQPDTKTMAAIARITTKTVNHFFITDTSAPFIFDTDI